MYMLMHHDSVACTKCMVDSDFWGSFKYYVIKRCPPTGVGKFDGVMMPVLRQGVKQNMM